MTFEPASHTDQVVTVRGVAYDARAGAIVELDDRTPIYIAGLTEWDEAVAGQPVEVTGRLRQRAARTPAVPPGGPQVHGLTSSTYVLEEAQWTVVA